MSSDDPYRSDYKKFMKNHKSVSNLYNTPLPTSDLRNKINSNLPYSSAQQFKCNSKRPYVDNSFNEKEWQKRKNHNIELEHQKRENRELQWRRSSNNKIDNKVIEESSDFDLYKEYIQWDFINNELYDKCEKLMNIEGRGIQELTNTLQRWFIFINEDFNDVPKYTYYSILPNINLSHPAAQFLRGAIIEKQFVNNDNADDMMEKILKLINRSHDNVIAHDPMNPLHVEYDNQRNIIVVNKFQSPEVPRINFLVKRGGIVASARMLLRYESFGNGSYQWGDPQEVHKVLHDQFNVKYEGFASPVNSRFIEYENTHFCSLFPETDEVFGSLGNFFHVDMEKHSGGWSVNPPFLNDLMKNVADHIIKVLDKGHKCYYFCTFPCWTDDEGWNILNNSRHLLRRFDLKAHHFIVQDAYGNQFEPKMEMNLFVLGELPENLSKLTELGNILIFDNLNALPSVCPW